MAQEQNYQVNYSINVEATKGTVQVQNFANAIGNLIKAKTDLTPAVNNIKKTMDDIDKAFRTKSGKKRDYSFKMNIDTSGTEEKLGRVKTLLSDIQELTKGINLVINAGKPLESTKIKSNAKKLTESRKAEIEKSAASSVETMMEAQKRITKAVGKINAALVSMDKGREVNIKTNVAKQRLLEILGLMNQIKGASKMTLGIGMGSPGGKQTGHLNTGLKAPFVYNPDRVFTLPPESQRKLQEKLATNGALYRQKAEFARADQQTKIEMQRSLAESKRAEWDRQRNIKAQEAAIRKEAADRAKLSRDAARRQEQTAAHSVMAMRKQQTFADNQYGGKRRAAINRMQYTRPPSLRNLPMMHMLNAYMAYGAIKSELTQAVEYANIMTSARSILRVADDDLTTFERRFEKMALNVRKVGVETKFTAVEIAGAVKYLSMAGMGIGTINESIRPITNLALIGDNDVSQIADLATNIMAGYDIKSESMGSVADILASSVSRSNVNVIEMAESYKMAAGYMRLAGVEFSESAAAIGILGNMGVKGTMAGTSLRAMATRFAKPTRESQKTLDRLGVKFTEYRDIYGKQVEKLRPLADIFEELNQKGATMGDMQSIFGKIGGNAAMMFVRNYDQLRGLTVQNRNSHGISSELALVKQETTKGLWAQVTSQLSESFMQGYEIIEPVIRSTLKDLLAKFNAPEFARGLASIGQSILNIFSVLGSIGAWFTRNFYWIEPLLFTGFVATKLFKLAGAVTNLGVALGFLGKQSAAGSVMQLVGGLVGGGGKGALSFGNKRAIVTALRGAGIAGKGAMTQAILSAGLGGGMSGLAARGAATGLFSTQVATGGGLLGAGASIGAIGAGAVAATAGIAALVGALGWVAYKTWKVKEAKDAMLEEITTNEKYRYPSIEALKQSLADTYDKAINAKKAVDDLTAGKTIEEGSGQTIGAFTGNWWTALLSSFGAAGASRYGGFGGMQYTDFYNFQDAYQDDTRDALLTIARKDSQARVNSAYAEMGKLKTDVEIRAFMLNVKDKFGQDESKLDKTLWTEGKDGKIFYKRGMDKFQESDAYTTKHYVDYMNNDVVPKIGIAANAYRQAMSSQAAAQASMKGFAFDELGKKGFYQDKNGQWVQKTLGKDATDDERVLALSNYEQVHNQVVQFTAALRKTWGGSAEIAENIIRKAGFGSMLSSNEPDYNDKQPFNANGITFNPEGEDDGGAGGNYSGTGKLSSAAPKQVIVNITNLLSVETIDLMKSENGQLTEIQNLKEQMAQALIDVVHDFDASWNG